MRGVVTTIIEESMNGAKHSMLCFFDLGLRGPREINRQRHHDQFGCFIVNTALGSGSIGLFDGHAFYVHISFIMLKLFIFEHILV